MVGVEGAWAETVEGIKTVVDADVYMMTNTTMTTENVDGIEETIAFAASLGVPTFGCNSLIYSGFGRWLWAAASPRASWNRSWSGSKRPPRRHHLRLIWYTPTQYCEFDPIGMELGIKGCTAARYNMCVEPNGDVLPCQSYFVSLGNILTEPWEGDLGARAGPLPAQPRFHDGKVPRMPGPGPVRGGCPLYAQHHEE